MVGREHALSKSQRELILQRAELEQQLTELERAQQDIALNQDAVATEREVLNKVHGHQRQAAAALKIQSAHRSWLRAQVQSEAVALEEQAYSLERLQATLEERALSVEADEANFLARHGKQVHELEDGDQRLKEARAQFEDLSTMCAQESLRLHDLKQREIAVRV